MKSKIKKNIILAFSAITTTAIVASIAAACSVNTKYELKPYNENFIVYENEKTFIKMQTNLQEENLKNLVFSITVNESKFATKALDVKKENNIYTFKLEISSLDKSKDNVIVISDNKKTFNTTIKVSAKDVKDKDSSLQDKENESNSENTNSPAKPSDNDASNPGSNPSTDTSSPQTPPKEGSQDQANGSTPGNADSSTNPPSSDETSNETTNPSSPQTPPKEGSQDQGNASTPGNTDSSVNPPSSGETSNETTNPSAGSNTNPSSPQVSPKEDSQDQANGSSSENQDPSSTTEGNTSGSDSSAQNPPATDSSNQGESPNANEQTPPKPEKQKLVINMETDDGYLKEENSGNPSTNKKSPSISWNKVEGAVSYAVVMIDYDASVVTQSMPFIHWMVANIKTTSLASIPITQKHDGTITGNSYIPSQEGSVGQAIYYYPATPPNGIHNYEIKVFALSKEIDSTSVAEVNNQVTYNKIEKAIFDAGVIDYDVKYVLGRQINDQDGQLMPKEDSTTNRLFKDDQKTFIDQIDLTNLNNFKVTLAQNQDASLSTEEPAFTFNDTNANAKSYLIMLTSSNSTQNQGIDQGTIHYAAIVSKDKAKKHIFNNAYGSFFYLDKYRDIIKDGVPVINQIKGNKMAILENEQTSSPGVYTITVMGIDEEFDTLLNNVNNIKNKYASQSQGHGGSPEDYNTVTNAFESIRNKVVSYGTTYKN